LRGSPWQPGMFTVSRYCLSVVVTIIFLTDIERDQKGLAVV